MNTIDRVKATIAKQLRIEASDIADDADIIKDLGANSIDVVEMLMTLEDEMDITIPDDVDGVKTVAEVAAFIDEAL